MPLDILSIFAAVGVPGDVVLASSGINGVTVEAVPNIDAAGGVLTVIETTAASDGVAGTATLQYTDVAGTLSDITVDLPEGYSVAEG
ncbi:hypothetical protein OAN307_c27760 [Octadecabacter antarcticus 307]|uniref:Uncharacterized protein n=1 Tax=Octadecabacter antarcticus 307 TaxID=391626 RepID=M9RD69_9RHOB|nr:hypothetical protein [Octadecabacter antarcticus]AGI68351.1 hypothetical protein OAN307_c27760 [Octadecabacter antarcticus 307]